jgi:putative tricarboxylic transport membrane protein
VDIIGDMLQAAAGGGVVFWALLVLGVFVGFVVGVLPGLTFVMGVLLILPFTYAMDPGQALVMMIAVYVAGTYGGALTAVLLNIPGEPNDVPLTRDGHTMARRGRAAEALGWAALAAFLGGLVGWLFLVFASVPFASLALRFGSAEYFAVVLLGLTSVLALSGGSTMKSLISMFAGMLLATVGLDEVYGSVRFDFGIEILRDGINYLAILVGVYALTEALTRFGERFEGKAAQQPAEVRTTIPGLSAIRERMGSFSRGMATGVFVSAGPGAGSTVGSFVAYGIEKQFGKHKQELGTGSPSGIIAPQAASTASVSGALIHLLVLGIPGSGASAVLLGVFQLNNINPGPNIFRDQPELIATIFAGLFVALFVMLVMGILAAKPMIRMLGVPEVYVAAFIVLFAFVGAFALRQSMSDVWIMTGFGILGFFMVRAGYPLAPLVLGAILGPLAERYFQTTMIRNANDWTVFFKRPLSLVLLIVTFAVFCLLAYRAYREHRRAKAAIEHHVAAAAS